MRLAASIEIAGRDRDFGRKQRALAVRSAPTSTGTDARLAKLGNLEAWYARVNLDLLASRVRAARSTRTQSPCSTRTSRRRGARTPCARSRSSPRSSTAELRIRSDPPLITPFDELYGADELARSKSRIRRMFARVRGQPVARAAPHARPLQIRACRSQGRRSRQRRNPGLDRAVHRPRPGRPALPAVEGGAAVGARALHAQERLRPAGPPRGRGAADDAGRRRHLARLDERSGLDGPTRRLLRSPALGLRRARPGSTSWRRGRWPSTRGCAAGCWRMPTPAPAIGSRSPRTSAAARSSTGRWSTSPPGTPTRTKRTTRPCAAAADSGRIKVESDFD